MSTPRFVLLFFLALLTFAPIIFATSHYPVNANRGEIFGQEIQSLIDYLRTLNLTAEADNIELYLNNSQIIIEPLTPGVFGESRAKGGPIYIDPSIFNLPPAKRWNPKNVGDVQWMIALASTLVHEKFHSENHNAWDRASGNIKHWTVGGNAFEVEAWNVSIIFLDKVAAEMINRANSTTNETEKLEWLRKAHSVLNTKLTKLADYDDNGYGPAIWNQTELEGVDEAVSKEIERINAGLQSNGAAVGQQQSSNGTVLKTIMDDHDAFELAAQRKLMDLKAELDSNKSRIRTQVALDTVNLIDASNPPAKVLLVLSRDTWGFAYPYEFYFLINYNRGNPVVAQVSPRIASADYIIEINESVLIDIYLSDDPVQRVQELRNAGAFLVSTPLGRQFEETCGNAVLDRGEQCDYGYSCPERLTCSVICDCIYPPLDPTGTNAPLPPRVAPQPPGPNGPDEDGTYWGSLSPVDQLVAWLAQLFQPVLVVLGAAPDHEVPLIANGNVVPNAGAAARKTCSDYGAYSQGDCNDQCAPNQLCKNYKPKSDDQTCYRCANVCSPNEFFDDARCAGTCDDTKECRVSRQASAGANGVCFVCKVKQRGAPVDAFNLAIPAIDITASSVYSDEAYISGSISNASEVNAARIVHVFNGVAQVYSTNVFNSSTGRFTFNHSLPVGSNSLTLEVELANGINLSRVLFNNSVAPRPSMVSTLIGAFELLNVNDDYARVFSLPFGNTVHFVVASTSVDVRQHLPILITITVNGETAFTATIANDPAANCRGADGCSIDGPLVPNSWQGKSITVTARNKDGQEIARYIQ